MTTPRHPLDVVPEPGSPSATTFPRAGSTNHQADNSTHDHMTDQKYNPMNGTNINMIKDKGDEATVTRWARRVFIEPWNELVCAVIGLLVDVVLVLVAVAYIRNGLVPTWLDEHGHLAWMGAGAVAALFLLGELQRAVLRLYHAVWDWLDRRYRDALAARLAAAELAELDGGEHR